MSDEQPPRAIVLASRASVLAKIQTNLVLDALRSHFPSRTFETSFMKTQGDKNQHDPLYLLGGKALFTQELETALLKGEADLLVHSLKDVPTTLPDGCEVRPILERQDPADALVVKAGLEYKSLDEMPEGSVVGTGSFRRVAQLKRLYPKLVFKDIVSRLHSLTIVADTKASIAARQHVSVISY